MLFAPKEKGQGLVEYALILVLVAIVVIAVLMLLGPIIGNVFSTINDSLSGVGQFSSKRARGPVNIGPLCFNKGGDDCAFHLEGTWSGSG